MKIKVTEDHIKRGLPGESDACPIALAIKEQFPIKIDSIGVGSEEEDEVEINNGAYYLPTEAVNWYINFDRKADNPNKKPIEPFEFEMEID